jgi:hypothetical protein
MDKITERGQGCIEVLIAFAMLACVAIGVYILFAPIIRDLFAGLAF